MSLTKEQLEEIYDVTYTEYALLAERPRKVAKRVKAKLVGMGYEQIIIIALQIFIPLLIKWWANRHKEDPAVVMPEDFGQPDTSIDVTAFLEQEDDDD